MIVRLRTTPSTRRGRAGRPPARPDERPAPSAGSCCCPTECAIAAGVDRLLDRIGTARLVAPVLGLLAAVHLVLAATTGAFALFLAVAVVWGLVNHIGLTLLLSRLAAAAPGVRGAVLSLNSAATYGGAAVAGALAGPLYEAAGFGRLAVAAAVLLALAVPVTAGAVPKGSGTPRS
jgi:predicted MFS family arabinose efflux permease